MAICSNCGASEEEIKLFDVISPSGIVKLCSGCLSGDAVALKKPSEQKMKDIHKSESLYQRLSREAGIDPEKHKKSYFGSPGQDELKEQEMSLRKLIDRSNEVSGKSVTPQRRDDLIENFHWVVMRARRAKKMTVSQVARDIGEPEKTVKLAEQGILPENDYKVITKLETVLGVSILRPEIAERIRMQRTQLGFDELTTKEITIADLREMKKDVSHEEKKIPYWRRFMFGGGKKIKEQEEEEVKKLISSKSEDEEYLDGDDGATAADFSEVEFDDTGVEISTSINSISERPRTPAKPKQSLADKEDLTEEEIDDLIFGRR